MRLPFRMRFALPARLPIRLPDRDTNDKILAAALIALAATVLAVTLHAVSLGGRSAAPENRNTLLTPLDEFAYDELYFWRKPTDRKAGPVVIVDVDQQSLRALDDGFLGDAYGWPWPRSLYGSVVRYLDACGAKVIGFDILFTEVTAYRKKGGGDDFDFADAVETLPGRTPVVFGSIIAPGGQPEAFKVPLKEPVFGAVNFPGGVFRQYQASAYGVQTLGHRLASIYAGKPSIISSPFWLHYYGPPFKTRGPDGWDRGLTFNYVAAYRLLKPALALEDGDAAARQAAEKEWGIDPAVFRGKIVLIGGTAPVLLDEKTTPVARPYPGLEVHATAVENILFRNEVHRVSNVAVAAITLLAAVLAAFGVLFPRRAVIKLLIVGALALLLWGAAVLLFRGRTIYFLPLAAPLLGLVLSAGPAFAYSYFTEDRQRRLMTKYFAQSTSPEIAEAVARSPELLNRRERRDMTVMFSDLAGFTDLSESLDVEKLADLMNRYLEEMTAIIRLQNGGTLDKYIGDAIMAYWNAPVLDQPDHAARACRSALAILRREVELQAEFRRYTSAKIYTRIGVNTGRMSVGNMGSEFRMAHTVMGDAVNLGSRLEGANKLYGTQILLSETTAEQVRGQFVLRQLDVLRVKGKKKPMAVYELMGEGQPDALLGLRVRLYEEALAHYRGQRWDAAEGVLLDLLRQFPSDPAGQALLTRVGKLRHDPPVPDWDGVYVSKDK